jgi:hypothetical protein
MGRWIGALISSSRRRTTATAVAPSASTQTSSTWGRAATSVRRSCGLCGSAAVVTTTPGRPSRQALPGSWRVKAPRGRPPTRQSDRRQRPEPPHHQYRPPRDPRSQGHTAPGCPAANAGHRHSRSRLDDHEPTRVSERLRVPTPATDQRRARGIVRLIDGPDHELLRSRMIEAS